MAVVLGAGAKVRVEHGHLVVSDGQGWYRRERRWNRATAKLQRLIIGAASGYVRLDALSWCQATGVAVIVVDSDGEVMLAPGAYRSDDARLRRVQAAPPTAPAVEAAARLLAAKLTGQAALCRSVLDRADIAETIAELAEVMHAAADLDELRQLEASAAAIYFDAWCAHPATILRFVRVDTAFVTELRRETTGLLRDTLGEQRLRELRAHGEAMNTDDAVAYALDAIFRAQTSRSRMTAADISTAASPIRLNPQIGT